MNQIPSIRRSRPARPGFLPLGGIALGGVLLTGVLGLVVPGSGEASEAADAPQATETATETAAEAAAESVAPKAGGSQRAVLDPETGELVVPEPGSEAEASDGGSTAGAPAAEPSAGTSEGRARQLAIPGAGVVAPFPLERVNRAVATVDEDGKASSNCKEGVEQDQ